MVAQKIFFDLRNMFPATHGHFEVSGVAKKEQKCDIFTFFLIFSRDDL